MSNHLCKLLFIGMMFSSVSVKADVEVDASVLTYPQWEFGLFGGAVSLPAYRGSSESFTRGLPVPYINYRGEDLKLSRESLRGFFFQGESFDVDISMFVDLNEDDDARDGMDELDPLFLEIGPALRLHFYRNEQTYEKVYLETPVRAALTIETEDDVDLHYRGFQGRLNLFYQNYKWLNNPDLELNLGAGVSYYDEDLSDYYYEVPERSATDLRPAYDADAGYAGFSLSGRLLYRINNYLALMSYVRYDNLSGTAFEDSPLVQEEHNFTFGGGLFWRWIAADERVPRM